MPRQIEDDWDDTSDDGSDDWEDETPTAPCPYCRRDIAEDTPCCPHCKRYLSTEDEPGNDANPDQKPWWVYIGVGVCLVVVYFWIVR